MRNKKLVLILSGVVLATVVIVALFMWKPWDGSSEIDAVTEGYYQSTIGRGNLPGNDLVAEEGDWIYYRNAGGDGNIYRISKDGSKNELIVGDLGNPELRDVSLQIWDGWLYYHNYNKRCVSRVKLNGSSAENLPMMMLNASISSYNHIGIYNEYIYAIDFINNGFYRTDINGENAQLILTDSVLSYEIIGEYLYYTLYTTSDDSDNGVYRIRHDGTSKTKLSNNYSISRFFESGGYLYYINRTDGKPYKLNIATNEDAKILDEKVWGLHVVDDWIYYSLSSNLCGENIYRMRMDGSENSLVFNETGITGIEYAVGWLYYLKREEGDSDFGFDDKLYRVRADGTNPQMVTF